ncbi:flavin-containing monooxygenase, partial [Coniochaeta ligniaria NRRL 30616]
GICGLVALKECLAAGLEAVIFEARSGIGGGWTYQPIEPDTDLSTVHSSMYDGAMLNGCRDTTSFTDFPLDPARYGDYFNHRQMLQYLHEYADHFGLKQHIRLRTKVLNCDPLDGGASGWNVTVQAEDQPAEESHYAAVLACTGHLSSPRIPDFKNRESFKGEFLHSHYYRRPGPFAGKRVAVIGLGSSGVDIACEIAPQATEVHIITRRGGWVLPRFVLGKPTEAWDNRATQVWVPSSIAQFLQTKLLGLVDLKPPKELMPDHTILAQNPTIRSDFLEKVRTKIITPQRASVESLTETGLQLSNGNTLDVDVIICATGYNQFEFPYLSFDPVRSKDTPSGAVDMYKFIMTPHYDKLFFLGYTELFGPLPPAAEAQARHVAALLEGRISRPSKEAMFKDIAEIRALQARKYIKSERHILTRDGITYIDDLLRPLGAVPGFGSLLGRVFTSNPLKAFSILNAVWFGIPSSAQWRLLGHGSKRKLAEETVLRIAGGKETLSKAELLSLGLN